MGRSPVKMVPGDDKEKPRKAIVGTVSSKQQREMGFPGAVTVCGGWKEVS